MVAKEVRNVFLGRSYFFLIVFLPLHFGRHVLQDGRSGKASLVYYS